jgi:hypothetical protein
MDRQKTQGTLPLGFLPMFFFVGLSFFNFKMALSSEYNMGRQFLDNY